MGRILLSPSRLKETRKLNIGHIIVFCEGKTEKFYFDYFAEIISSNKYSEIEVKLEDAHGNARAVLNYANDFLCKDENNAKFSNYGKYLVFDCDAPNDIQNVICEAHSYKLLVSNYLFETWLLMHFEDVNTKITKKQTYKHLTEHLQTEYKKGHKGITRAIIQKGDLAKAIANGRELEQKYKAENKSILTNINDMNPFVSLHCLIEQFLIAIS